MSLLARITAYLAPNAHRAREHREENSIEYAAGLIAAERRYWNNYLSRAVTQAERDKARHELDHLDALQRGARVS